MGDSANPCTYPGCDRPIHAKTLCRMHYRRQLEGRDMDTPPRRRYNPDETCSVAGCDSPPRVRGMCELHRDRDRKGIDPAAPLQGSAGWRLKRPQVEALIQDGASLQEIMRTTRVAYRTLRKHFPDYRGWGRGMPSGSSAHVYRQGVELLNQRIELKGWVNRGT